MATFYHRCISCILKEPCQVLVLVILTYPDWERVFHVLTYSFQYCLQKSLMMSYVYIINLKNIWKRNVIENIIHKKVSSNITNWNYCFIPFHIVLVISVQQKWILENICSNDKCWSPKHNQEIFLEIPLYSKKYSQVSLEYLMKWTIGYEWVKSRPPAVSDGATTVRVVEVLDGDCLHVKTTL